MRSQEGAIEFYIKQAVLFTQTFTHTLTHTQSLTHTHVCKGWCCVMTLGTRCLEIRTLCLSGGRADTCASHVYKCVKLVLRMCTRLWNLCFACVHVCETCALHVYWCVKLVLRVCTRFLYRFLNMVRAGRMLGQGASRVWATCLIDCQWHAAASQVSLSCSAASFSSSSWWRCGACSKREYASCCVCVCVYVCVCYIRMHVYLGKPEPLMCTVYDRIFGDFPAN